MAPPIPLQFLEIEGYRLAFQEAGRGSPVLFVHGSMLDYRAWAQQLPAFARAHTAIAVSLRHCYPDRWDGRTGEFSVNRHCEDLAAFIRARGLGPVHLVGHSRGGAVALQLALRHPALVHGLVLADPGGLEGLLPDTPEAQAMADESVRMFARLRDDLAAGDTEGAARAFVNALSGPLVWERRTATQRQLLLDNINTGPACAERPRWERAQLAALPGPIFLVTGARSPRRYHLMLPELQRCNPQVKALHVVPDAAHAMNRENPAVFNAAVMGFIADQCYRKMDDASRGLVA